MVSFLEVPEAGAPFYTVLVCKSVDIFIQVDGQVRDSPTPDVKPVVIEYDLEDADHPGHAPVPFFLSFFFHGLVADVLVIVFVLADGMVGQLQMRQQVAVDQEGGPDTGAQRDSQLETFAAYDAEA